MVKLWREINTQTYKIGKSIVFIVTRPVKREVFAADFRDRIVQHLVVRRLEPLLKNILYKIIIIVERIKEFYMVFKDYMNMFVNVVIIIKNHVI